MNSNNLDLFELVTNEDLSDCLLGLINDNLEPLLPEDSLNHSSFSSELDDQNSPILFGKNLSSETKRMISDMEADRYQPDSQSSSESNEEIEDNDSSDEQSGSDDESTVVVEVINRDYECKNKRPEVELDIKHGTWKGFVCSRKDSLKEKLLWYQCGFEWYRCSRILKERNKNQYYCKHEVIMHPEYVNNIKWVWPNQFSKDVILEEDLRIMNLEHSPLCTRCVKHYNGTGKPFPIRDLWRRYRPIQARVRYGFRLKDATFEEEKIISNERALKAKAKGDGKSPRPTATITAAGWFANHKTMFAEFGDVTPSALLERNRALCWSQHWYNRVSLETGNCYEQEQEVLLHERVLSSGVSTVSILTNDYSAVPQSPPNIYDDFEKLLFYFTPPKHIEGYAYEEGVNRQLVKFDIYTAGNSIDKSKMITDGIQHDMLLRKYMSLLNHNQLVVLEHDTIEYYNELVGVVDVLDSEKRLFYPSIYHSEWTLEDINRIFDGYKPNKYFSEGEVSFARFHFYATIREPEYKFYDWVGKWRAFREFLNLNKSSVSRRATVNIVKMDITKDEMDWMGMVKLSPEKMSDKWKPQVRYILSRFRNVVTSTQNIHHSDFINKVVRPPIYPDTWQFLDEHLVKFNPNFQSMSEFDKVLTQRRFHNFVKFFMKKEVAREINIADIIPENIYLQKMRGFIESTYVRASEDTRLLYPILADFFKDEIVLSSQLTVYRDTQLNIEANSSSANAVTFLAPSRLKTKFTNSTSSSHSRLNQRSSKDNKKKNNSHSSSSHSTHSSTTVTEITNSLDLADTTTRSTSPAHKRIKQMAGITKVTEITYRYWMYNDALKFDTVLESTPVHVLVDDIEILHGNSLIASIHQIYTERSYSGDLPTSMYIRKILVDNLRRKLEEPNLLFQLDGLYRLSLFKETFIKAMRDDEEYKLLMPMGRFRQEKTTIHDDVDTEIRQYLDNKLLVGVELTPIDAIQLAMITGMHSAVYYVDGIEDLESATREFYHYYVDHVEENILHHLWIFLYDTTSKKFLIRNGENI